MLGGDFLEGGFDQEDWHEPAPLLHFFELGLGYDRVRSVLIITFCTIAPGYWSRRKLAEYHEIGVRMSQKDLEIFRYRLG
ncbi:MAG: hypothetical protein Fur0022_39470 [Anaerolineales bacterium]